MSDIIISRASLAGLAKIWREGEGRMAEYNLFITDSDKVGFLSVGVKADS